MKAKRSDLIEAKSTIVVTRDQEKQRGGDRKILMSGKLNAVTQGVSSDILKCLGDWDSQQFTVFFFSTRI